MQLGALLGLPPHERALLLFASLVKYKRDLRAVMVDCKVAHSQEAFQLLASLAGASTSEVAASLRPGSRLETLGLIEPPLPENSVTDLGDLMRISDRLLHVLLGDYASEADMMAVFTRPSEATLLQAFAQSSDARLGFSEVAQCMGIALGEEQKSNIQVRMVRLRKKLHAAGAEGAVIEAIRNVGYQFFDELSIRKS